MSPQQLIEDNINLVYSLISKEYPTYIYDEDLIQSGMLGLCKAANTWEEGKAKFSSYAWKCIRNEIYQEFKRRKPFNNLCSLDAPIGDGLTLAEVIVGDEDVQYVDFEPFFNTLTKAEQDTVRLKTKDLSNVEIAHQLGVSHQTVSKTIRRVKHKWEHFNNE
jgi:RNA polymerase sigma factor (sigma-70 family)